MIINVLCSRRYSKKKIRSEISRILNVEKCDWLDGEYLFDKNILIHVRSGWISFQSFDETNTTYSTIRDCLDLLFSDKVIKVYGNFDNEQIEKSKNVEIRCL